MACRCSQKAMEMQKAAGMKSDTVDKKVLKSTCCSGKNQSGKPTKCCCGTGCQCPSCNTTKL